MWFGYIVENLPYMMGTGCFIHIVNHTVFLFLSVRLVRYQFSLICLFETNKTYELSLTISYLTSLFMLPLFRRKKGSQNTARCKDDDVIETESFLYTNDEETK